MNDPFDSLSDGGKHLIDALSLGTLLGTLLQVLPGVAALLTIIWTAIRILETETVRGLIARFRK